MKKTKRELGPGLHLEVFQGSPDNVHKELQEWFLEFQPLVPISFAHGFSGGEFWLSIVYMLQGSVVAPVPGGMVKQ